MSIINGKALRWGVALIGLVALLFQHGHTQAIDLPDEAYVSGFVGHAQQHHLSCEARSAADWAAFMGVPVSENEILAALPYSDNPEAGFVGNVDGYWGSVPPYDYGVYPQPVAAVLRDFGLPARAAKGLAWDDIREEVAAGRPVVVWLIGAAWPGTPIAYTAADWQTVTVARFEHTMTVTGYSPTSVRVVDAGNGAAYFVSLDAFLKSWEVLGQLALLAGDPPEPTPTPTPTDRLTVVRGDTLTALARRYNLSWTALSEYNRLAYPYFIYPGQILFLPQPSPTPSPETPSATPTPEPTATPQPADIPETYVVQTGDYLSAVAKRFGLEWPELARLNHLFYPYVIYTGQALRLR